MSGIFVTGGAAGLIGGGDPPMGWPSPIRFPATRRPAHPQPEERMPAEHPNETPAEPPVVLQGHTLRLVADKPIEEVDPYKFERRRQARWQTAGRVTYVRYGDGQDGHRDAAKSLGQIGSLELLDASEGGVGAWSPTPLPEGATLSMFIPGEAGEPGADRFGTVRRCEARDGGFEVGIQVAAQRLSAA